MYIQVSCNAHTLRRLRLLTFELVCSCINNQQAPEASARLLWDARARANTPVCARCGVASVCVLLFKRLRESVLLGHDPLKQSRPLSIALSG